jgi:hypothetical protein
MPQGITSPESMAHWMGVLDQVQDSLARALHEADEHERALAESERADAGGEVGAAERRCLDQIDERLRGLQAHLDAAGRTAAAVEALLAEDEREARAWADLAAAARRRLARGGEVGIS